MIFEASRAKAVDQLNNFIEQNLTDYSKLRNFDFGTNNRSNISCLSPYITHGTINEPVSYTHLTLPTRLSV